MVVKATVMAAVPISSSVDLNGSSLTVLVSNAEFVLRDGGPSVLDKHGSVFFVVPLSAVPRPERVRIGIIYCESSCLPRKVSCGAQ